MIRDNQDRELWRDPFSLIILTLLGVLAVVGLRAHRFTSWLALGWLFVPFFLKRRDGRRRWVFQFPPLASAALPRGIGRAEVIFLVMITVATGTFSAFSYGDVAQIAACIFAETSLFVGQILRNATSAFDSRSLVAILAIAGLGVVVGVVFHWPPFIGIALGCIIAPVTISPVSPRAFVARMLERGTSR